MEKRRSPFNPSSRSALHDSPQNYDTTTETAQNRSAAMSPKQAFLRKTTTQSLWLCLFLLSPVNPIKKNLDLASGNELSLEKVILVLESTALSGELQAEKEDLESHLSEKLNRLTEATVSIDTTDMPGSFQSGKIDLAFLSPREVVPLLDRKVASIFLVRLAGEKPEKSIWLCKKEKNYADISETKGKAIAFANRSSDPGCLLPIRDLSKRKLIGPDRALTDFFSHVIYGDDSDSVVRKLLNGEVEAAAVGSSAFENLDEKTQSRLRIFQEQGSVPTGVLCIRSSISSSDRAIIEEAFLTTNADNPNLVRRVFGERLAKPEKGHLDLTRETLEAIKTVKP